MSRIFRTIASAYNFVAWLIGSIILLLGFSGLSLVGYILVGEHIRNSKTRKEESL